MKVPFLALQSQVAKKIYPYYLLSGDEPFQIDFAYRMILNEARKHHIEVNKLFIESSIDPEAVYTDQSNYGLFAQLEMLALLFNKVPDKTSQKILNDLITDTPTQDKVFLIRMPKLTKAQQNTQWFHRINQAGLVMQAWEPNKDKDVMQIIRLMLNHSNLTADPNAIRLMIEQTHGNLFSAYQLLQQFRTSTASTHIEVDDLLKYIENSARYSINDFINSWLYKDTTKLTKIFEYHKTQASELNLIIWSLAKAIRILILLKTDQKQQHASIFQYYKVYHSQQTVYLHCIGNYTLSQLRHCLYVLSELDEAIKNNQHSPGELWMYLKEMMCDSSLHR